MARLASLLPKIALFAVSMLVGGFVASVAVNASSSTGPQTTVGNAPAYLLAGPDTPSGTNVPVAFNATPSGSPAALPTLSPKQLQAAAKALIGAKPAKWVNPTGFARITPITQFDNGPLQNFNCTMASGAMLARLASGIVTNGSTLRSLQAKQVGGTNLNDLAQALWHGYGVAYHYGLVKQESLKSLLKAGYGAVVQGIYGQVPIQLRLQKDFTGGHAIYLDGYYPGDPAHNIPEAYYVVDPLGHPYAGYEGDWWPAAAVDRFLSAFSGTDRASAMWAYPPGGKPPAVVNPDVLPMPPDPPPTEAPSASPSSSSSPSSSASESPSPSPSATESPSASPSPGPPGSIPPYTGPIFVGDEPVYSAILAEIQAARDGAVQFAPFLDVCLRDPKPPGCPTGFEATVTLHLPPAAIISPGPSISVLFVDAPTSNMAIVGYTVDPATTSDVQFWEVGLSPASVHSASAMTTTVIDGQTVVLARLDVAANTEYQFQVAAGSGTAAAVSPVGDFTSGAGVSQFDVTVGSVPSPSLGLGTGFSPYLHVPQGALVPPLVPLASAAGCTNTGSYNGVSFCLDPVTTLTLASCTQATVAYTLDGLAAVGVVVRAYPQGGSSGVGGIVEATGPAPSGTLQLGCLTSGLSYTVALSAQGDDHGVLAQRTITVP